MTTPTDVVTVMNVAARRTSSSLRIAGGTIIRRCSTLTVFRNRAPRPGAARGRTPRSIPATRRSVEMATPEKA
ncbi:hypothetical protein [Leifsonia sp. NPDC058248]|uniref:hypothetical protein n=1 Tax=Leifsonia sp. NPDC058248 TaxID=3346402 RepID=UPI0036D9D990